MLHHQLLADKSVLVLEPHGPLTEEDFKAVAAEVDPFIEAHENLGGVMIQSETFPGWRDFASMMAHLCFVRDHHEHIKRVAFVTNDKVMSHFPDVARHFVSAEVKHFTFAQELAAFQWLEAEGAS